MVWGSWQWGALGRESGSRVTAWQGLRWRVRGCPWPWGLRQLACGWTSRPSPGRAPPAPGGGPQASAVGVGQRLSPAGVPNAQGIVVQGRGGGSGQWGLLDWTRLKHRGSRWCPGSWLGMARGWVPGIGWPAAAPGPEWPAAAAAAVAAAAGHTAPVAAGTGTASRRGAGPGAACGRRGPDPRTWGATAKPGP